MQGDLATDVNSPNDENVWTNICKQYTKIYL